MDGPVKRRRISPQRKRRIARMACRLRQAIRDDPLLLRLPPGRELACFFGASVREVRYAMALLVEEGLIRSLGRRGYQVVPRPSAEPKALHTVMFICPSGRGAHSFISSVVLGSDKRCRELGLRLERVQLPDKNWAEHLASLVAGEPVDGVGWLVDGIPSPDAAATWVGEGRRLVLVDFLHPQMSLPAVLLNHASAARLAVEHLRSLGHRNVAMVCRPTSPVGLLLSSECQSQGLSLLADWQSFVVDNDASRITAQLGRWGHRWQGEQDRPTAVIVHDLNIARTLLGFCGVVGIRVPRELSLLAVGSRWGRDDLDVTLASAGRAQDLGRLAVDALVAPDVMDVRAVATTPASLDNPGATTARPATRTA